MKKSVLCAINISQPKREVNVLKTALKLAQMDDAQLDIITVIPDFGTSMVSGFFNEEQQKKIITEAKHKLNEQVADVLGDDINAKARHIVASGKSYQEILKVAEAAKSSLIVVGGTSKSDLTEYVMGPTAARVVRHSNCSVYVVR